jgi:uncharacterized protein DUF4240
MNLETFWEIISESRREFDPQRRDGNMDRQRAVLEQLLSCLPNAKVKDFDRIFDSQLHRSYRWDLWHAAELINAGCSDDGFMDFRNWLISMGREVFEAALKNPESLASVARAPGVEVCAFEGFGAIAPEVLERRGIEPKYAPWPRNPAGKRWKESEFPTRMPKLWVMFGKYFGKQ